MCSRSMPRRRRTASCRSAATIGVPDTPHTTDTSKGTIKLYSSWPLHRRHGAHRRSRRWRRPKCASRTSALRPAVSPSSTRRSMTAWRRTKAAGSRARKPRTSTGQSTTQTAWSTWAPTTPARPRFRFRSRTRPGMAQISFANTYPGLTIAVLKAPPKRASRIFTIQPASATTCGLPGGPHPGRRRRRWAIDRGPYEGVCPARQQPLWQGSCRRLRR